MRELLTDKETAKILGIRINQLYDTVDFFDRYDDDPWNLSKASILNSFKAQVNIKKDDSRKKV